MKRYYKIVNNRKEVYVNYNAILHDLLKHKKMYVIVLSGVLVWSIIYTLGLPDYYTCSVQICPNMVSNTWAENSMITHLKKKAGITDKNDIAEDAFTPLIYPELIKNVEYSTKLFNIKVRRNDDKQEMTYYEYLTKYQKVPWWVEVKASLLKGIKSFFSKSDNILPTPSEEPQEIDPFRLTDQQMGVAGTISGNVSCTVDRKSLSLTITARDQDPLICATIADSATAFFQKFIHEYRTQKARQDLDFRRLIYQQCKERYYQSSKAYSSYVDANRDVLTQKAMQKERQLETDMRFNYEIYSNAFESMMLADGKVQEAVPVFLVIKSATVPIEPSDPDRLKMSLIYLVFAFVITTLWLMIKEDDLKLLFE